MPEPLPWAALVTPLAAAEDALARLDQLLATSPIRNGWCARTAFADACASLALQGDLVLLEELVLHDAGRDRHALSQELTRARAVLRARRRRPRLGHQPHRPRRPVQGSGWCGRSGRSIDISRAAERRHRREGGS